MLAQINDINLSPGGVAANLQVLQFSGIIGAAILLILIIAAVVFFFMLVVGGVRWITSGGDKAQTEAARGQITAALVGLVIIFAAWAIVQLVSIFFGFNILGSLAIPNAVNP